MNNMLTKLALFHDSIYFSNNKVECSYVITFDFSYDIVKDVHGYVLTIHCPDIVRFNTQNNMELWENVLIKIMKRKRFH